MKWKINDCNSFNDMYSCEVAMGVRLNFPFGTKEVLTYVGYLLKERKVARATIEKYLSGIRYSHYWNIVFAMLNLGMFTCCKDTMSLH